MKASENPYRKLDWISTGFFELDKILGGGIPSRKITEISGPFSIGKTTLALQIVGSAQSLKKKCLWADVEWVFDENLEKYAQKLGVDLNKLELSQSKDAESMLDEVDKWIREEKNTVVVIDAVGALHPRDEAEKSAEQKTIGSQSKLVAAFCRRVVPYLAINNNALIVLNHEFTPIMNNGGRPVLMTSGGKKLEYHKSIWLKLGKSGKNLMQSGQKVGEIVEAEIRKNKLTDTRWQKCELQFINGQGFIKGLDLMEQAKEKLLTKKGQFWYLGDDKLARGENGLREFFKVETNATMIKDLLV